LRLYIAVTIDYKRNVNHVSTNGRLQLLSKLFPMAFDTARLDAVARLMITSAALRTLQHVHLKWEYWLLGVATFTNKGSCLAELTVFHMSQALRYDQSEGWT